MVETTATDVTAVGAVAVPPLVPGDGVTEVEGDAGGRDSGASDELDPDEAVAEGGVAADDEGSPDSAADATDEPADSEEAETCVDPTVVAVVSDDTAVPDVAVAPVAELAVAVWVPVDVAVQAASTRIGVTSRTVAST
jgi:hypothetical protein